MEKYFANNEARRCKATDYAKGNGAYVWNQDAFDYWLWNQEGCGSWWLRSPSPDIDCYVYGINAYGNLVYIDVSYCGDVVRPALWINLHSLDRG